MSPNLKYEPQWEDLLWVLVLMLMMFGTSKVYGQDTKDSHDVHYENYSATYTYDTTKVELLYYTEWIRPIDKEVGYVAVRDTVIKTFEKLTLTQILTCKGALINCAVNHNQVDSLHQYIEYHLLHPTDPKVLGKIEDWRIIKEIN